MVHQERDRAAVEATLKGLIERREFDKLLQTVLRLFDRLSKENDALRQEVRSLKRKLYDRSSEKGEKQEEPNTPDTPDTPDTTDGVNAPESTTPKVEETPKDKTGHGRGKKPNNLPIVSVLVELTPGQRICPDCQSEMEDVRSGDAWQIEFIPGRFVVEDLVLQRAGCPNCRSEFAQVNVPKVIPGSPVGPGLLARVLTDKAEDHLPLDRQQKRMEREGDFVAKTTLANWWRQGADLLMPLQALLLKEAMSAFMPQIDATGLQVYQSTTKKTGDHHLWCVVGNDAVSFQYASKKTETLAEMLAHRSSITLTRLCPVQSDGDSSFSAALKKIKQAMVMIQGNMHARRKFFEALKSGDKRAAFAIAIYGAIYGIERECTEQNLTDEQRTVERMTRTLPELEKLREWSQALLKSGTVLKTTPLYKAIKYLTNRWLGLTCFVIDGRIPIDNGEAERQIRWIAKGRDNWNLCGSPAAAVRLAMVASVCATCRRIKINPSEYLTALFKAIARGLDLEAEAENWTPWAWAARMKTN